MTSLKDVKQRVPWPYRKMLRWYFDVDNKIVKAVPNRKLSVKAFSTILKCFREAGGGYVSGGYFELALFEKKVAVKKSLATDIHAKLENKLAHVTEAARRLAREG